MSDSQDRHAQISPRSYANNHHLSMDDIDQGSRALQGRIDRMTQQVLNTISDEGAHVVQPVAVAVTVTVYTNGWRYPENAPQDADARQAFQRILEAKHERERPLLPFMIAWSDREIDDAKRDAEIALHRGQHDPTPLPTYEEANHG